MDKITNAKDKTVGKAIETVGRVVNDKQMEFTGKFRQMTTGVKDKLGDVKEDVYEEGSKILDKVDARLKGDKNNGNR